MRQIALSAAIATTFLVGCAAKQPTTNTYSYESQEHSGTVAVTETFIDTSLFGPECPANWREGTPFQTKGIPNEAPFSLSFEIKANYAGLEEVIGVDVPSTVRDRVLMRDLQVSKNYMLGSDANGLIKQGEHFFYPEGFFVRASNPSIEGGHLNACLGIDRMYVPEAELQSSSEPTIRLDRLVIPFHGKAGETQTFSFGSSLPIDITITPKIK